MKNFRLAPLALAIGSMSLCVPLATSQAAAPGDLSIYTTPTADTYPTIMLMVEASTFTDEADEILSTGNVSIIGVPEQTTDKTPSYYRRYFYPSLSPLPVPDSNKFYTRLTRLKDAIYYLMDTPGLLPDNYKVGVGRYSGTKLSNPALIGDSTTGGVYVAADTLGPASESNNPTSQRYKIKQFIGGLCGNLLCTGQAPMARAYTDVAAYMMGTKSGQLSTRTIKKQRYRQKILGLNWQKCSLTDPSAPTNTSYDPWVLTNDNLYSVYWYECKNWVDVPSSSISTGLSGSIYVNDSVVGRVYQDMNAGAQYWQGTSDAGAWGVYSTNEDALLPPLADSTSFGMGMRNAPMTLINSTNFTYAKPNISQCSGVPTTMTDGTSISSTVNDGIFFLTAAYPNRADTPSPNTIMNWALTPATPTVTSPNPTGGDIDCSISGMTNINNGVDKSGWDCIGAFSKRLNSTTGNPSGKPIKTAVFDFVSNTNKITDTKIASDGTVIYNCNQSGIDTNLKYACNLGTNKKLAEEVGWNTIGGYGDGGFFQSQQSTSATNAKQLADAISKMGRNLMPNIGVAPTGTPIVPNDPLNPNMLLDSGYLPLIAPTPAKANAQWAGNLRKYEQIGNTFFDKQSPKQSPFSATALLSPTTLDLWSSQATAYKSSQQAGGVYEKLPTSTNSPTSGRNVYLSEATSGSNLSLLAPTKTSMDAVSVTDIADQNDLRKLLLNYMGYNIASYTSNTQDADIQSTATKATSIGGVNHSTPFALVAKPVRNTTTGKIEPTKRYIVFGAMDNALHIVDDDTGEERLSFIPKEVLKGMNGEQYKALTTQNTIANGPAAGVDAPWTSYAAYRSSTAADGTITTSENLYLYGGARMGAQAYYGIDVTGIEGTNFTPKQLFTITPTSNTLFSQLGYTWAKPVITKIRWQGQPKLVAILSGGYDKKYDATDAAINTAGTAATATKGNAIYIVDAVTGAPLIVAGQGSSTSDDNKLFNCHEGSGVTNCITASAESASTTITPTNSNLKYSVAGSVKTLDRDADELADAVYFADLNGQVFRLDINNRDSKPAIPAIGASAAVNATNPSVRLVQLANLNTDTTKQGPRFYEAPTVTVHQQANGERFVVVSLASGDRSNPLDTQPVSNYIYGLYDKDVGNQRLYKSDYTLLSSGITIGKTDSNFPVSPTSTTSNYSKNGWRLPIDSATKRDGTALTDANQKLALKAFGPLAALNSKLFVSVYNPNDGATVSNCSSQVLGTTEAYQVCLPYGYCNDTTGTQYQRIRIGKGLQSIMFGNGATAGQAGRSLLVSEPPATGQTSVNISGLNTGTGVPTTEGIWNFASKLRPMLWYDMQQRKNGTATN